MAHRRSLSSLLFRTARRVDDLEALTSGNPKRIERRVKNRVVGRVLRPAGFWRWLWKSRHVNGGSLSFAFSAPT